MKVQRILVMVAVLAMAAGAQAEKKGLAAELSGQGYATAGCGLGSIVFGKDNRMIQQVLAATLNGTGVQTFAISTGTSNCDDSGALSHGKAVPAFIEMNSVALAKDASRGQGETLASLASLMGCQPASLGPALQQNYKPVFMDSKMNPAQIEAGINQVIAQNNQACGS